MVFLVLASAQYHLINWPNWLATRLGMEMHKNISKITRACPTQPCYMASVQVTVPTTEAAGEPEVAGGVRLHCLHQLEQGHDSGPRASWDEGAVPLVIEPVASLYASIV